MLAFAQALYDAILGRRKRRALVLETCGLTRQQIDVGRKALHILGLGDSQEQLSKQDVILFLYAVGLNPTDDVLDSKFRLMEVHGQEYITFAELCHIWHSMLQDLTNEDEILEKAFYFFDKDGNGEITVTELRNTMRELGDLLTEQEIESFMQIMDVNNDGVIGYREFIDTLKTQAPHIPGTEDRFFKDDDCGEGSDVEGGEEEDSYEQYRHPQTDQGGEWTLASGRPMGEGQERTSPGPAPAPGVLLLPVRATGPTKPTPPAAPWSSKIVPVVSP